MKNKMSVKGNKVKVIKMSEIEKWFNSSKNRKTFMEFFDYCMAHPEERFWQALRNWAKVEYIYTGRYNKTIDDVTAKDTFYWKGRNK